MIPNCDPVDRIVSSLLYEGYILYPYRPSVKNRHRWTFGGLYPEAYCRAEGSSDAWANETNILLTGGPQSGVEVNIRFLHLIARNVGVFDTPKSEWLDDDERSIDLVESLQVGDRMIHAWQEAEERRVQLGQLELQQLLFRPIQHAFHFPSRRWVEPIVGPDGLIVGAVVREQQAVKGSVTVAATQADTQLFKLTVCVSNITECDNNQPRNSAVLHAMVSTHAVMHVTGGDFISLIDPPQKWRPHADSCHNVGTWPVLVGEEGQNDTVLSSPIIIYDYPQVAPESPGDLFDGTEIDEILTLRILTLTEEEKRQIAGLDERARDLLLRTERLQPEQLMGLHGTFRRTGLKTKGEEA